MTSLFVFKPKEHFFARAFSNHSFIFVVFHLPSAISPLNTPFCVDLSKKFPHNHPIYPIFGNTLAISNSLSIHCVDSSHLNHMLSPYLQKSTAYSPHGPLSALWLPKYVTTSFIHTYLRLLSITTSQYIIHRMTYFDGIFFGRSCASPVFHNYLQSLLCRMGAFPSTITECI